MNQNPCKTVVELGKEFNVLTGLVVTSRITHATPASFAAHVIDRDMETEIAHQMVGENLFGKSLDLMFGGGECFFLPNTSVGSCRTDSLNVYHKAVELGWNVYKGIDGFKTLDKNTELPILNLMSRDHMEYEIDRDSSVQPSLLEMTMSAINILGSKNKPFFLMIEGSRIDMAAHTNDPAAHLNEILMYNSVVDHVKEYINENPNTILVATSDHETGGLSVGHQHGLKYPEYKWNPQFLQSIKKSSDYLAKKILESSVGNNRKELVKMLFLKEMGIEASGEDLEYLDQNHTMQEISYYIANITSEGAQLGWATHGHTAVDVNL